MNQAAIVFLLAALAALLVVRRQWAPLPLLCAVCYMTLGQGVEFGPFRFTVVRILILVSLIRVWLRRERPVGGSTGMDWLMCCWAAWALCSSVFHANPGEVMVNRLGMIYNAIGVFFLFRCFTQSEDDVYGIIRLLAIVLLPVAVEMLFEQVTHRNLFAVFGGVSEEPMIRNGRVRSEGPFGHAILAGTVGVVCAPLMVGIWRKHPVAAKLGLIACCIMVFTSGSGGPFLTLMLGGFALIAWRWRHLVRQMCIAAIIGYILLDIVMKAPAYYLIARIPLAGSTTWHRAALIEAAISHLNEWWAVGTDRTRHWMPYGVPWSEDHTDITNHYIAQGVRGGLPLMLLFISILWCGFRYADQIIQAKESTDSTDGFFIWSLGSSLFTYTIICISVALFDQSSLFLYLILASLTSVRQFAMFPATGVVEDVVAETEQGASFLGQAPRNGPS